MADMKDFRCDVCLRSTCVCPRPDPEFTALVDSLSSLRSELAAEKAAHEATKKELERFREMFGTTHEFTEAEFNTVMEHGGSVESLAKESARLREAIEWALGERGTFAPRPHGAGAYWWRSELRRRAALAKAGDHPKRVHDEFCSFGGNDAPCECQKPTKAGGS